VRTKTTPLLASGSYVHPPEPGFELEEEPPLQPA
jgi:hypothetical protein